MVDEVAAVKVAGVSKEVDTLAVAARAAAMARNANPSSWSGSRAKTRVAKSDTADQSCASAAASACSRSHSTRRRTRSLGRRPTVTLTMGRPGEHLVCAGAPSRPDRAGLHDAAIESVRAREASPA
jgi:hypothetical protein